MIYFDNSSTTYVYPDVVEEIYNILAYNYANPSNLYSYGVDMKQRIEEARNKIADILDVKPNEIIFTSSASESNATTINYYDKCYCSRYEHHDIKENPKTIQVDEDFLWTQSKKKLREKSIYAHMLVNNETGEIFDLLPFISKAHSKGFSVLVDATQALGNIRVNPYEIDADYMSFSLHKVHGPKGIGILYVKEGMPIKPIIFGSQENGRRGSTENTAYIIGGATAVEIANMEMNRKNEHCLELRKLILARLKFSGIDFIINEGDNNIPSILNIAFKGITGEALMLMLDDKGFCISTGSACNSGDQRPSEVLQAMKVPKEYIEGAIRISMSLQNTLEEADLLAKTIVELVKEK